MRVNGIPVYVVGLNTNPAFFPALNCIADRKRRPALRRRRRGRSSERPFESLLDFKRSANFFASPSLPAFAGGFGDTAQIGAVVPSHLNENGDLSSWSIWSGTVKSYQLDSNGLFPVVTAPPTTPTPTATSAGPTATPVPGTPTPTPAPSATLFADETRPEQREPGRAQAGLERGPRPRLHESGARPRAQRRACGRFAVRPRAGDLRLAGPQDALLPSELGCAPAPRELPARHRHLWRRHERLLRGPHDRHGIWIRPRPPIRTSPCSTVQFLRGGKTNFGRRDEILNDPSIRPATIGTIGPATGEEQRYSYFYQDDASLPGDPPQVRTDDDGSPPAGYAHKLGDIFHSELLMLEPPRYFQYLSANVQPRTGPSTTGEPYLDFATRQAKRRKVLFVGANDGFLHAFDGGVWDRDAANFAGTFDLGTGREIFAYSPTTLIADKFTNLLNFPPLPQYFVDGSMDERGRLHRSGIHRHARTKAERVWRTILVGGLRQGGHGYFALDVTQPDDIDTTTTSPTFGEITGNKDASPGCLDGSGPSCNAGA